MFFVYLVLSVLLSALTVFSLGLSGVGVILFGILFILLYMVAALLLHVLFLFILSCFVDKEKPVETDSSLYRKVTAATIAMGLRLLNVHVRVTGLETVPKGRFLLIQNHRSAFDPLISLYALDSLQLGFITKPENMEIPIVGKFAHKICALPIDRENPRNAMKTIHKAADFLTGDVCSIGLYPEGTRNKEAGLLPFHNGSLKIAVRAGVPIVVTAVTGTDLVKKNAPFRRTNVEIHICGVIPAEEVKGASTASLGDRARAILCRDLGWEETPSFPDQTSV